MNGEKRGDSHLFLRNADDWTDLRWQAGWLKDSESVLTPESTQSVGVCSINTIKQQVCVCPAHVKYASLNKKKIMFVPWLPKPSEAVFDQQRRKFGKLLSTATSINGLKSGQCDLLKDIYIFSHFFLVISQGQRCYFCCGSRSSSFSLPSLFLSFFSP